MESTQPSALKINFTESLVKVIVVGDKGCGKVSLIERYASDKFPMTTSPIVGVKMLSKVIKSAGKPNLRVQFYLIDSSREDLAKVYYKESTTAFILFDVTQENGLAGAQKWKEILDSRSSELYNIPMMLVATKTDLPHDALDKEEMDHFCEQNEFAKFIEVSALTGDNVSEPLTSFLSNIDSYDNCNNSSSNFSYIKDSKSTQNTELQPTEPKLERGLSCCIM